MSRVEPRPGGDPALWFAALGAVAAWAIHLFVGWLLEEVVACAPAASERGEVLGVGLEAWVIGLTVVLGAVAVAAGIVGFRRWRRRERDGPSREREAFMGLLGALAAGLFLPIILMGGLQGLALQPCAP